MAHPARVTLAVDFPDDVAVVEIAPENRRLVTGVEGGSHSDAAHLADDLWQVADRTEGPCALNMTQVDWIDSGACAVLIKFWKELRTRGRALTLAVTEPVRETFVVTGLVRLVPCFATVDAAVEAARIAQAKRPG